MLRLMLLSGLLLLPTNALAESIGATVPTNTVVLHRRGLAVYEEIAQSFRARLRTPVKVVALSGDLTTLAIPRVRALRPDLVFALGQSAYDLARTARLRPLVYAYVFRDGMSVDFGIHVQVRPDHVLETLKGLQPRAKQLALLYGPSTAWIAEAARVYAKQAHLEIHPLQATGTRNALSKLRRLPNTADALWLVADLDLMSEQVVRYAIALQFRRRMPLIAPSQQHVQRGALVSLDYAPDQIAQQATRVASRLLLKTRGPQRARELARWASRSSRWGRGPARISVNALTAERIDIALTRMAERVELVQ